MTIIFPIASILKSVSRSLYPPAHGAGWCGFHQLESGVAAPDCIIKMQEEMDKVVGKHRTVEEADLPKLPYVRAAVKEGLRLHGSEMLIPRRCNKDTVLDGYHIAADTVVLIYMNAMQPDPAVWSDAYQFRPERFLNWEGYV